MAADGGIGLAYLLIGQRATVMWIDALRHVLTAAATAALIAAMLALAKRTIAADATTNAVVLRHHRIYRWLMSTSSVGVTALGPLAMWLFAHDMTGVLLYGIYTVAFGTLTVFALAEAFWAWGAVTPEGIVWHTIWKGTFTASWTEIDRVTYSGVARWFVIRTVDGRKMRISVFISGILALTDQLRRNLPSEKLAGAANGFAELEA